MTINADHQVNYDDCGLYAIAMSYDICNGVDPLTRHYMHSRA